MSLKNKLVASAMELFQRMFGEPSISSVLTPYRDRGVFGVATNRIRIHKSWLTLLRSDETYTLAPDGRRVEVDARVSFGPVSFLFLEHDIYPATVIDGGMRNLITSNCWARVSWATTGFSRTAGRCSRR